MATQSDGKRVIIIGAGAAGLTCARHLQTAGVAPLVLEKSRGIGGRLATRRRGDAQFDHGAPGVEVTSEAGRAWLETALQTQQALPWAAGARSAGLPVPFVGRPGMSALCRSLAQGLDIRFSTEVTGIARVEGQWRVDRAAGAEMADVLVLAIPAPQAMRLLSAVSGVPEALDRVSMSPCWTFMAQFAAPLAADPIIWSPGGPFSQIICDSGKPGRETRECWVAHTSEDWAAANLEIEREDMQAVLLAALAEVLGPLPEVEIATAHRWRYARTRAPLGKPFQAFEDNTLFLGGDWTLGRLAEHAVQSGAAVAKAVVDAIGADRVDT